MWNVLKKRATYLRNPKEVQGKPGDSLSVTAGDRLDRLKRAQGPTSETDDPFESGPIPTKVSIGVAVPKDGGSILHSTEGAGMPTTEGAGLPMPSTDGIDAAAAADHHQRMADYFSKEAGTSTPNTTQLSPYERSELDDEINMTPTPKSQ